MVAPVRVDPAGLTGPTRKQARGPGWRRTSAGFYLPSDVSSAPAGQRIVEAAMELPEYGGVTGWAGLHWQHARWSDGTSDGRTSLPVALAIGGANLRPHGAVVPTKERLAPGDLVLVDGLWLTTAVRSTCFEMRYAESVRRALVHLDMAAYSDLVSIAELAEYAGRHSGWTGIPQCREALLFADENSWSPMETGMRLVWTLDGGHPRPVCNTPIFDAAGRHIGTPDLFDPEAGVVGEYDGALHLQGARRALDVRREAAFRAVDLEYVTMLAADTADPGPFLDRLAQAYGRARWLPTSARRWTIARPAWWLPTDTVDQRRALTAAQRTRLLGLRAA